ncbi:MAG: NADAR family protein [Sphingobacteriales bacterium]|nr:MAG: NADAR family protein [Sphingobacteriales bacterium]
MAQKYSKEWLIENYEQNELLKYLYFWGHTPAKTGFIDKSCFSQWYPAPFEVDGRVYKTAEHWMMAKKALLFGDESSYDKIVDCNKPGEAKDLGRQVLNYNEDIWKQHRYDIVRTGNIHKFQQHTSLADFLLATDKRILVEASPVDAIWGIGLSKDSADIDYPNKWRGLNLLGFALMEVRDILAR